MDPILNGTKPLRSLSERSPRSVYEIPRIFEFASPSNQFERKVLLSILKSEKVTFFRQIASQNLNSKFYNLRSKSYIFKILVGPISLV